MSQITPTDIDTNRPLISVCERCRVNKVVGPLQVVPVINETLDTIKFDVVVYSMDWHPNNHLSFVTNVSKYPLHPTSPVSVLKKLYATVSLSLVYAFNGPLDVWCMR